jgi:hypothetical protein
MTAGRFPPWFISARRGIITPEENIHAVDVIDLSDIACKGDLVFCKVYQQLHLVDGFTLPFIVPYVGLPGAATGKRNDRGLGGVRVGTSKQNVKQPAPRMPVHDSTALHRSYRRECNKKSPGPNVRAFWRRARGLQYCRVDASQLSKQNLQILCGIPRRKGRSSTHSDIFQ